MNKTETSGIVFFYLLETECSPWLCLALILSTCLSLLLQLNLFRADQLSPVKIEIVFFLFWCLCHDRH